MFFFRTFLLLGLAFVLPQPKARCADFIGEIASSRVIESDSGVVDLAWSATDEESAAEYELEKSTRSGFSDAKLIYQGSDSSTYLTGLQEGDYFFRVREAGESTWSEPVQVKVEFISRGRLFALLGVGFVVCIATAAAILQGHMRGRAT